MSDAKKIDVDGLNFKRGRRTRKTEEYIEIIEERIVNSKKVTQYLNDALNAINNFPYKDGEVVTVRNKGTGIIVGIEWGEDNIAMDLDENFANKFYAVIATKEGYEKILLGEVMPYNSTTKVLYERKNE